MTTPTEPQGTGPLKPGTGPFKGPALPPKRTPTDALKVEGARDVIKGTGKLTLPSVNLDDIEIPGL